MEATPSPCVALPPDAEDGHRPRATSRDLQSGRNGDARRSDRCPAFRDGLGALVALGVLQDNADCRLCRPAIMRDLPDVSNGSLAIADRDVSFA
jgi:hypothetical protein